jgi:hypothetical protein
MDRDRREDGARGPAADRAWFVIDPTGLEAAGEDGDEPVVGPVYISNGEPDVLVPLWSLEEGYLSEHFDELHRWLGISRALYDDLVEWQVDSNALGGNNPEDSNADLLARRLRLEDQLAAELHPGIDITRYLPPSARRRTTD